MHAKKGILVIQLICVVALVLVPGAAAQDEGLVVTVMEVDSLAFPQVTLYLNVSDSNGQAVAGLTAADFQLLEEGISVPPASVVVEPYRQALRLVLALDVSLSAEALTSIREAVSSFIDTVMGAQDEAALMAFYDEVKLIQGLTGDKEILHSVLDAFAPYGNYTALNEAVFQAAEVLGAVPEPKAVIAVTNAEDNLGVLSVDEAISKAQEAQAPVYMIGFGPRITVPSTLDDIAVRTGGQAVAVADPENVGEQLLLVGTSLQQGYYKVTFQSGMPADNAAYDLSVQVTYQGRAGEVQARPVAVPGEVVVVPWIGAKPALLGGTVNEMQGMVRLTAEVTAPATVVSVEYLLDDVSLAQVTVPPYSFDWDSATAEVGEYLLSVQATDGAGNEGRAEIVVRVILPVVEPSPTPVPTPTPPPEEPSPAGWTQGVAIGSLAVFAAATAVVLVFMVRWRRKSLRKRCRLEIHNEGNMPSRYALRAERVAGMVRFLFSLDGTHLPVRPAGRVVAAPVASGEAAAPAGAAAAAGPSLGAGVDEVKGAADQAKERAAQAQAKAGQVKEKAGLFTSIAATLGSLLPGSAGQRLREMSASMRAQQTAAARAMQAPQAKLKQAQALQAQAAKAAPAAEQLQGQAAAAQAEAGRLVEGVDRPAQPLAGPAAPVVQRVVEPWAQTPVVQPGETLALDLIAEPLKRSSQDRRCSFKVHSRSVEGDDSVQTEGNILLEGVSWFRLYLPALALGVAAVLIILLAIFWLVGSGVLG